MIIMAPISPHNLRIMLLTLLFLPFLLPLISASKFLDYCSPPGPHIPYVPPEYLKTSPAFQEKLRELDVFLQEASEQAAKPLMYNLGGEVVGGVNLALSLTTSTETVYTFNYGLPPTDSDSDGQNPWTEHTVFRVASVSKALTVWELLKLGIGWDEKVVKYLPELMGGKYRREWSEVTVGALAGYVGGATRDFEHDISLRPDYVPKLLGRRDMFDVDDSTGPQQGGHYYLPEDIIDNILDVDGYVENIWASYLPDFHPTEAWKLGFPPLDEVDTDRCLYNCTRGELLSTLANRPLVYPAFTNPAYSNVGFSLLGLVMERKSGLPFDELMQRDLYTPLGMKDTFHEIPDDIHFKPNGWGASPFWGANDTWWETREIWGDWGVPAGGIFTSAHDLSIFIRTILCAFPYSTDAASFPNQYCTLPPDKIRAWLSPTGFTGGKSLVGRPWEIKRRKIPGVHAQRAVTLYSKAGGGTGYNSGIIIIPEYGVGLTILIAGDGGTFTYESKKYAYHWIALGKLLLESKGLLKAIEDAAYESANLDYVGEYLFHSHILDGDDGSRTPVYTTLKQWEPIFSGMEIISDSGPGLRIRRWVSNGTDFLQTLVSLKMQMKKKEVDGAAAVARLYPVGNVRSRKGGYRWAEDWRLWLDWEWENLDEAAKVQPSKAAETNDNSIKTQFFKQWKNKHLSKEDDKIEHDRFLPEILPGGLPAGWIHEIAKQESMNDGQRRGSGGAPKESDGRRRKPIWKIEPKPKKGRKIKHPPVKGPKNEGGGNYSPEDQEDQEEEYRGIPKPGQPGWQKPKKSSATVITSEDDSQTWNNRGPSNAPPWWRPKYDSNSALKDYQSRKALECDDEVDGQPRRGNGKSDRVVNYTSKKSNAKNDRADYRGAVDMDREFDWDEDIAQNKRAQNRYQGEGGVTHREDVLEEAGHFVGSNLDDEEVAPMYLREKRQQQQLSPLPQSPFPYAEDQDNFEEATVETPGARKPIQRQWELWKANADRKKEKKPKNTKWPCTDYNGVEMQAWAGWSLGLVRFIREGPERTVVGIEVPALKVRLEKVGSAGFAGGRKNARVKMEDGEEEQEQDQQQHEMLLQEREEQTEMIQEEEEQDQTQMKSEEQTETDRLDMMIGNQNENVRAPRPHYRKPKPKPSRKGGQEGRGRGHGHWHGEFMWDERLWERDMYRDDEKEL